MMDLTCRGCGHEGHVPDDYAGLRVTCTRCRTENAVPESGTREIEAIHWVAAIDASSEAATVEVDMQGWLAAKP